MREQASIRWPQRRDFLNARSFRCGAKSALTDFANAEGAGVKATLSDVAACFRIILGREPSLEEIAVHAKAHIGNDLADVLKKYLESEEFRNRRIVQFAKVQQP